MKKILLSSLLVLILGTIRISAQTYYCCQNQDVVVTLTFPTLLSPAAYNCYYASLGTGMSCNAPMFSITPITINGHSYSYQTATCPSYTYNFSIHCTSLGTYTVYFGYRTYSMGCSAGVPTNAEQTSVTIVVGTSPGGGSITGGSTPFCYGAGTTNTGVMTLGGYTGKIVKWQKRVNSGTWTDIANTGKTYSEVPSSAGTWDYRAVVNLCYDTYSSARTIVVNANPTVGITPASGSVCPNTNYSLNGNASGGSGSYTHTWTGTGLTSTNAATTTFNYGTPNPYTITYSVVDGNGCSSSSSSATVTVNPLPSAAGSITGNSTVCQGESSVSYSIPAVTNATSYSWTYSGSGATFTNGTTRTPTITFASTATSGTLTASGVNACGNGTSSSISITVNPLPVAASSITGSASVCQAQSSVSYSINSVTYATGYSWTYSGAGATITNGNTASPTFAFSSSATSGTITAKGTNSCGSGTASTLAVTVNPLPGVAAGITGSTTVCQGQAGLSYSVPAVINATSYNWSFPGGASITNGTTRTPTISYNTSATSNTLSVYGINSCGNGTTATQAITVNPLPSTAGSITGSITVCQAASGVPYSIGAVSNATGYSWTYGGTGATINGSTNSITIDYASGATSGTLTVKGTNACGNGGSNVKAITVNPLPVAAGAISGTASVCQGTDNVGYSVGAITNATSYIWAYSGTGATFTNGTTSTPKISFATNATSGNLTVKGTNSCGDGTVSANYAITIKAMPTTSVITGNASPSCSATGIGYSVTNTAGSSYAWTVPSGASITAGAGTNSITVSFGTSNGNVSVTETNVGGCAGDMQTQLISLVGCGLDAAFIVDNTTICEGNTVTFTNTSTGTSGGSTYAWDFGSGASPATATGAGPHTVTYTTGGSKTVSLVVTEGVTNTETKTNFITVNPLPVAAGPITGSTTVCQGQIAAAYSVGTITNATGYDWTYSGTGATYSDGSTSCPIDFATNATSGTLTVKGTNACGNGTVSTAVNIVVNPLPGAAGSISGAATNCQGATGVAYSVGVISDATSYTWTYGGTGATMTGTTNSVTADYSTSATSGNITVKGTNACGNGTSSTYAVTINNSPTPKFLITPTDHECSGTTMILVIDPQSGQAISNYNFMVNGVSKQSGVGNTMVTTTLTSTDVVTMEASSANGCAKTITAALTIDDKSNGGTLSGGDADICQGSSIGTMTMNSSTGSVVRWEKSNNGGVSWTPIVSTAISYTEANGVIGDYVYRVVVKNGVCAESNSANSSTIKVHSSTVGGGVLAASKNVTLGQNATLTLSANNGSVVKWQTKKAGDVTWTDIVSTSNPLVHAPATADTTYYKAVVQNSVCPSAESTSDWVNVINPLICVVRFDAETGKNKIVWERTGSNIKSYKIYSVSGTTYTPLATVPYADYSQYIDMSSDPTSQRSSYSMTTVNNSDVESGKSSIHKTMLLTASKGTLATDANLIWQPYVDESGKIAPDSVFIYKGKTKDAMTLLKGLTYDNTMYVDHTFDGVSAYYQLAIKILVCTPDGVMKAESGPYSQSLSNLAEYKAAGLAYVNQIPASVYPSPFCDIFNVEFELENAGDVNIEIVNALGSIEHIIALRNQTSGVHTIQVNAQDYGMSTGLHYVKIVSGNKISVVKCLYLR